MLAEHREDWVLPEDKPETGLFHPGSIRVGEHDERMSVARKLIEYVKERLSTGSHNETDFIVVLETSEGAAIRYRAHCERAMNGKVWMFRRILADIPDIKTILPDNLAALLLAEKLNQGGLVIIAGRPGQGKSTTCASVVSARLKKFGGLCITTEDPPELPLSGYHGTGLCIQREWRSSDPVQIEQQTRSVLRAFPVGVPGILYFGELRDKTATNRLLEAALNGLLIFITMHAGDPRDAIARIIKLSGGGSDTRSIMATSLKLVLHQQLLNGTTLIGQLLMVNEPGIEAKIRDGRLPALKDDLQNQRNRLRSGFNL